MLPAVTREACDNLIEEQRRADVLRAHGLEPRHRILLAGPPGNGKTSLSAPITLVVMPEECQSIPITAPNDWNQNGWARRRSNSSRP
jgi:hypothetical protein